MFSPLFAVCFLLFLSSVHSALLQFSHQASLLNDEVNLLVNEVPVLVNISYAEVSEFIELSPFQEDTESTLYDLSVVSATTGEEYSSGTYDVSKGSASLLLANSAEEENSIQAIFQTFTVEQPQQFNSWLRFVNLAPTSEEKSLVTDGESQSFSWGELSTYEQVASGEYNFQVVEAGSENVFATLSVTLRSGEIVTLFFNGQGDDFSPFTLVTNVDLDFSDAYTECLVRFVNSAEVLEVVPIFEPGNLSPFESVETGSATDYEALPIGEYVIFLDDEESDFPSINFTCEASQAYTITFQGDDSLGLELSELKDHVLKASYLEARVRVDLLSTFDSDKNQSYVVSVDGVPVAEVKYAEPTPYLQVETTNPTITISQGDSVVFEQSVTVELGQTFSSFVLGSDEALFSSDSGSVNPTPSSTTTTTTTTTTSSTSTTGSTTSDKDSDDDDGDDGLSGGAIAGIVIAVLIGFFGLIALTVWFLRRRGYSQT